MKQILKILPALLILTLGIIISFWIYSIYKKKALSEKENQISTVIENNYRDIQQQLAVSLSSIEILRFIFEEQKDISKEEFKNFTAPLLKSNPGIKALSWVPKITNEERAIFENKISEYLRDKVVITKRNSQNEAIANEENPIYFPVTYIEPLNENNKALGYNIYSDDSRQKTIDLAINKGEIVITPRLKIVQDTLGYSFLGIAPVFVATEKATAIANVKGLISAVFTLDNLINAALANSIDPKIAIAIVDVTDNKKELIYGNEALLGKTGQFIEKRMLPFGGRTWEINFIISPVYYQITDIKNYLIGGIAISFLLFMLLLAPVIKERRRIVLSEKLFEEQKVRARTQESLSESEEKYKFMFANNPQPMWIFDLETLAFLEINNAAINHYGYTREEFLSMTIADIRPKEEVDPLLIFINQQRNVYNFAGEWRHLKKNGEIIIVEITSHEITYNNRQARHVMVNDITERKKTEGLLRNQKEQYDTLVQNIPIGVYKLRTKPNGEILFDYISPKMCELIKIEAEEAYVDFMNAFKRIHPDELEKFMQLIKAAIQNSTFFMWEGRALINKELNWFRIESSPTILENGDILWDGYIKNITDRKEAEEKLRLSNQTIQNIIDNTSSVIYVFNLNGEFLLVNKKFEKLLGVSKGALIGHTRDEFLPKEIANQHRNNDLKVINSKKESSFEEENMESDGKHFYLTSKFPLFNAEGNIYAVGGISTDVTESKQAEAALKQSEERFASIFRAAPGSMILSSLPDGKSIEVNENFSLITGYSREEALGLTTKELNMWVDPSARERFLSILETDGVVRDFEADLNHKSGTIRKGLLSGHIFTIQDKKYLLGTFYDITERKQIEIELRAKHKLVVEILESMSDAFVSLDKNWCYTYMNEKAGKIFGRDPKEMIGKNIWTEFPEGVGQPFQLNYEKAMSEKVFIQMEEYYEPYNLWFENRINPTEDGLAIFFQNITERKQAEDELKRNEKILKLFVKHSPAAIVMFDKEMKYIVVSDRFKLDYGLGEKNIIGLSHYEIFPELKEEWKAFHQRCLGGEILKADEEQFVQNNGSIGWLRWEIHPWYDKEGEIGGLILFSEAITDRIKAQEEIKILNTELEQRVIERTAQLDAANKELQTFTYSVSHDLKAPLRGIDGYSNLLQELYAANLNEEARSFISSIRKGTAQMNMLIEDLLEYSRLERAALRIENIKIKPLLETLKSQFKPEFSDSNFKVNINVPDIEITADSKGLTIALRNLMDNAIKFSKATKKPTIDISFKNKPTYWEIAVKDNGIGFEMKYKDRIFEIFQQLNLPEEFPGTGIGLAMVHKSMEKMGGKVWAESTAGKGATFYLQIPKQ